MHKLKQGIKELSWCSNLLHYIIEVSSEGIALLQEVLSGDHEVSWSFTGASEQGIHL